MNNHARKTDCARTIVPLVAMIGPLVVGGIVAFAFSRAPATDREQIGRLIDLNTDAVNEADYTKFTASFCPGLSIMDESKLTPNSYRVRLLSFGKITIDGDTARADAVAMELHTSDGRRIDTETYFTFRREGDGWCITGP